MTGIKLYRFAPIKIQEFVFFYEPIMGSAASPVFSSAGEGHKINEIE